jgi:hypothetical protein
MGRERDLGRNLENQLHFRDIAIRRAALNIDIRLVHHHHLHHTLSYAADPTHGVMRSDKRLIGAN